MLTFTIRPITEHEKKWGIFALGLLVGGLIFFCLRWEQHRAFLTEQNCAEVYPFLSTELDCKDLEEKFDATEDLGQTVKQLIDEAKQQGNIDNGSFFYRDLNTRRFVGVNDTERYHPASLTKLPIVLAYYKLAELRPGVFDRRILLSEENLREDVLQTIKPAKQLGPGEYRVEELIRYALVYSQNAAVAALRPENSDVTDKIYADLGVYIPSDEGFGKGIWNVTTKTYANLLRILYNGSYLTLDFSNQVLSVLSQSGFRGGIAKVPHGVRVAHKFGEATKVTPEGKIIGRVLNHCGIVYKPDEPYIICIMTEGHDFEQQKRVIERIAEYVYKEQ